MTLQQMARIKGNEKLVTKNYLPYQLYQQLLLQHIYNCKP
jgi:hypothetical protein